MLLLVLFSHLIRSAQPLLKTRNHSCPMPAYRPWWRAAEEPNQAISTCKGEECTAPHSHPVIEHSHNSMQTVGGGVFHVAADDGGDVPLLVSRGVVPSGCGGAVLLSEVRETDSHLWSPTKAKCFWRSTHPNQLSPRVYFFDCSRKKNKIK